MIADIILIIIILLCIFLGYTKGLIKVAVRLLSFVISLIVALILYTPISNYIIENTEIVSNLKNTISSAIYTKEEKEKNQENVEFSKAMENYINEYTDGIKENTSEFLSEQIAVAVVRIGTWIGLFVLTKLLTIFIRIFADAIAQIPIIKQFNKVGGTVYGVLEGFVITYVALAILSMVSPMLGENAINKEIDKSNICKAMYENNILLKIIL